MGGRSLRGSMGTRSEKEWERTGSIGRYKEIRLGVGFLCRMRRVMSPTSLVGCVAHVDIVGGVVGGESDGNHDADSLNIQGKKQSNLSNALLKTSK